MLATADDTLLAAGTTPDYSCVGQADPAMSYSVETEISGIVLSRLPELSTETYVGPPIERFGAQKLVE